MDQATLDHARTVLDELRGDLRAQLHELGAIPDEDAMEIGDMDFGFADSAQSTAERGKVLALVERLRDQLRDVDRAIAKLEKNDGTYGLCENCGQAISPERLEALPYSRLCVTCKQKSG
jgi:DnaK suppressor protein